MNAVWRRWNARNVLATSDKITRQNWKFVFVRATMLFLIALGLGLAALWAILSIMRVAGPLPVLAIGLAPTAIALYRRDSLRRELAALGYRVGFPRCLRLWHEATVVAAKQGNARTFAELRAMLPPRDELALAPAFARLRDPEMVNLALAMLAESAAAADRRASLGGAEGRQA